MSGLPERACRPEREGKSEDENDIAFGFLLFLCCLLWLVHIYYIHAIGIRIRRSGKERQIEIVSVCCYVQFEKEYKAKQNFILFFQSKVGHLIGRAERKRRQLCLKTTCWATRAMRAGKYHTILSSSIVAVKGHVHVIALYGMVQYGIHTIQTPIPIYMGHGPLLMSHVSPYPALQLSQGSSHFVFFSSSSLLFTFLLSFLNP